MALDIANLGDPNPAIHLDDQGYPHRALKMLTNPLQHLGQPPGLHAPLTNLAAMQSCRTTPNRIAPAAC